MSDEENLEVPFNEGHIVEGLQTCHIIMGMLDEYLMDHQSVVKAGAQGDIQDAIDAVMNAYQAIGGLE